MISQIPYGKIIPVVDLLFRIDFEPNTLASFIRVGFFQVRSKGLITDEIKGKILTFKEFLLEYLR